MHWFQTAPGLYISEDSSRRVREQRAELMRFSREIRKRHPEKVNYVSQAFTIGLVVYQERRRIQSCMIFTEKIVVGKISVKVMHSGKVMPDCT